MGRQFVAASSDREAVSSSALSGFYALTLSTWLWHDADVSVSIAVETDDANLAFSWSVNFPSAGLMSISVTDATNDYQSNFPMPSDAAWHHFLIVAQQGTSDGPPHSDSFLAAWVDGVAQTLTIRHDFNTLGPYPACGFSLMSRNTPSLYQSGRMAELAWWGSALNAYPATTSMALALFSGATPLEVHPDGLLGYIPQLGADSPEPDYSGKQRSATLTGTAFVRHPRVRSVRLGAGT